MKIKNALILLVFLVVIVSISTFFVYNYLTVVSVREIPISLTVGDEIGFNLTKQELNFGTIPRNGNGHRDIELNTNESLKVTVLISGDVKKFVYPAENGFVVNGNKRLAFNAIVKEDAEFGNYSGKAVFVFRKGFKLI